jgi:hypothetical protein
VTFRTIVSVSVAARVLNPHTVHMKKLIAATLLALAVAAGTVASPAHADDTSSAKYRAQAIDWM